MVPNLQGDAEHDEAALGLLIPRNEAHICFLGACLKAEDMPFITWIVAVAVGLWLVCLGTQPGVVPLLGQALRRRGSRG